MLFSERSLWTMVHGIGLGGAALHVSAGVGRALIKDYARAVLSATQLPARRPDAEYSGQKRI